MPDNNTAQNSTADLKLAFLGTGSMNGAIMRGIIASGHAPERITATVRTPAKAVTLAEETGVNALATENDANANLTAVADADVVFLGVKPVGILDLSREIAGALKPTAVVVSVAAGITVAALEAALKDGQPVVRSMPNTPLTVGLGAVGLAAGAGVDEQTLADVVTLYAGAGVVKVVPEDLIEAVTAVSGSGPAYVFYLAEAMAAAGEKLGLDAETARELASATVAGAGRMLAEPGADPAQLRRNVTSPNGTTAAALDSFAASGLEEMVFKAETACVERSRELTRDLSS
ncbi:pyrroline-5-carboxylate reductase [Zhihengliuella halotolerans]|uniref:Pyrroline-5-carboxylate reductase n=1 Tax=Zhihengliuella halotolerans TaxID=370736 RepID=A0A4Q8ADN8_9MICC|nr:pyrroline-5-carboxylate reductase [Zhihengliuella halotolerans]RZU62352.1 pyrroline-5-carboxylate reductase [Zhihengliuella halotolerans]